MSSENIAPSQSTESLSQEDTYNEARLFTATVPPESRNERLDRFLGGLLRDSDLSRERIKRAIREGDCMVNDRACTSPSTKLSVGQTVTLSIPAAVSCVTPEDADVDIVYRDAHIAVVNKPSDLTVHPCPSCPEGTLVHRLVHHFEELQAQEGFRPGIVHRIDKDTSGLLLVALSESARLTLSENFADRTVHKEYLAIVHGVPDACGEINEPIGRHPSVKVKMAVVKNGKEARSSWRVLHTDPTGALSLVAVRIYTGRTHQIRVHMAHLGHPLWGDAVYGPATPDDMAKRGLALRQMLHAWHISFTHPVTDEVMEFHCPPPQDFLDLLVHRSRTMLRLVLTGSAGCGKSTVLRELGQRGIPTWSADTVVAELYQPNADGWHALRTRFGHRFIDEETNEVDRRALFAAMQEEPRVRREVEAAIHPLVIHHMKRFFAEHEHIGAQLAVAEVPLFLEIGGQSKQSKQVKQAKQASPKPSTNQAKPKTLCHLLVGVACEQNERHSRLAMNRHWSPETTAAMDSWQWPDADKMAACDVIIDNSASSEALSSEVDSFLCKMKSLHDAHEAKVKERMAKLFLLTSMPNGA
ncbi:MAG: dephospho-CoA kinase [Pseudomonadota bacterium]